MIDTLKLITDSLNNKVILKGSLSLMHDSATDLDYFYKVAMILIAAINVSLVVYIYCCSNKRNIKIKDADRKVALFKTLILDYNLRYFYDYFDKLKGILSGLRESSCDKKNIEKEIQANFRTLNEQFIEILKVVDMPLYISMLKTCDTCRDDILGNIGDDGANLWTEKQYNKFINTPLNDAKKGMLGLLFNYNGE